ncbi:MAG: CocE/NonD family hydrolase, partial [Pseudomonadota bacterium]
MRLETVRRTDMADHIDHPFDVSETDHLWIEMTDGVRLAARLWRPVTQTPVPAILEYIPYRKSDMVRARDERNHPFFAANGYACIRVDMRGSGDSEGHMPDMYAEAELDDARQVIEWLAAQPWCTGRVGMFGTSWGGTAALQASVDAPEPLKAVIAVCATHDRFQDDIHYMGGCVLSDTFEWGATLPAILASPPTPNAGRDWQSLWKQRLQQLDFPLQNWLRERGRGTYWRRGSVIHDARSLSVPILSVGGWSDRYSNSVMALVDARPDLVWGVVGPWGHHYPDHGSPGPAIGFQRLALGWWDHWLKPAVPKDPDWPRLRVWLRGFDPPGNALAQRAGRWIESGPAGQETVLREMSLDAMASPQGTLPLQLHHDPLVGQCAGDTGYFGRSGGLPLDQTPDDARSLVFETDPLTEDVVIYGSTRVQLSGTASGKPAPIVARLSDVDTNGVAARISYGVRNLALDENPDHT